MAHSLTHHGNRHTFVPWRAAGWWLTGILAIACVVVVTLRFTEISKIADSVAHMHPAWLIPALAMQLLSYICAAGVWGLVTGQSGARVPFTSLVALSIGQVFARQALPSAGISGNLLVLKGLSNRHVPRQSSAACIVVSMISFYAGYATAIALAMGIFAAEHALSHHLRAVGALMLGLAGAAPFVLLAVWRYQAKHDAPRFVQKWEWSRNLYKTIQQARGRMPRSKAILPEAAALQLGVFVADAATLFVVLLAFGHAPPPARIFAVHVMANAVGSLTPVPLGLGAYEAACIFLLHRAGTPLESALESVLIFRGLSFWLPMLPGFFIARRELKQGRFSGRFG